MLGALLPNTIYQIMSYLQLLAVQRIQYFWNMRIYPDSRIPQDLNPRLMCLFIHCKYTSDQNGKYKHTAVTVTDLPNAGWQCRYLFEQCTQTNVSICVHHLAHNNNNNSSSSSSSSSSSNTSNCMAHICKQAESEAQAVVSWGGWQEKSVNC